MLVTVVLLHEYKEDDPALVYVFEGPPMLDDDEAVERTVQQFVADELLPGTGIDEARELLEQYHWTIRQVETIKS